LKTGTIILLVILAVLVGILVALYFFGRRMQEKQEQQNAQLQASKQPFVIMAVDKKRLKLKESGLPDEVINNTPWYAKRAKVPVVKAKIGNRFMNLIADENVFDYIPINKQVKAMIKEKTAVVNTSNSQTPNGVYPGWFNKRLQGLVDVFVHGFPSFFFSFPRDALRRTADGTVRTSPSGSLAARLPACGLDGRLSVSFCACQRPLPVFCIAFRISDTSSPP
jgi:uncharacterized protein YneF (UPF0154 family)